MRFHGKRRDANEGLIIAALEAVGASVQQLDGDGVPDLLCGLAGVTHLIEVKAEHGKAKVGGKRTASGLRESQERWHRAWQGAPVHIVTNTDEALRAIGARRDV